MASALISQPVLSGNPATDCNAHITALLDELRQYIDGIPVVPGCSVAVAPATVLELRGVYLALNIAIRARLKWVL